MMSTLDSLLSSIGGGPKPEAAPNPQSQSTAPKPVQPARPVPKVTNGADSNAPLKRKAEGDLAAGGVKVQKREGQATAERPRVPTQTSSAALPPSRPQATSDAIPYRGTAKSAASSTSATAPAVKPAPGQAPVPATKTLSVPATAPKKGSYQEILARAKAAQEAKPAVGSIKHKPVEKVTKRERLAQTEAAKKQQLLAKDKKGTIGAGSRSKSPEKLKGKPGEAPVKEKKKPVDLGYTGTMRPKAPEPTYKGTMNSAATRKPVYDSDRSRPVDRSRSTSATAKAAPKGRYTYASYSDEEEEEDDYESDASSDMEAAAWDLENEEQQSLRAAKKEDEEALAEENRLKREKAQKKKKLQQLAKAAAQKKKVY